MGLIHIKIFVKKTRQLWYLIKGILLTRGRGIKEKQGGVRGGGGGGGGGRGGGGGWNPLMEDERDGGQVEAAAGCSLQCEAGEQYFHQPLAASKELEGGRIFEETSGSESTVWTSDEVKIRPGAGVGIVMDELCRKFLFCFSFLLLQLQ